MSARSTDKSLLNAADDEGDGRRHRAGGITGNGSVVVVDNTSDNTLVSFRFKLPNVKMQAAEDEFDANGHHFAPGAFVIADANRAQLEPALKQLGLSGYAVASAPTVKTHDLDIPRIGYVHSWTRTQDEGWVRAAFDHVRRSLHLLRRAEAQGGKPPREVRRHRLAPRRHAVRRESAGWLRRRSRRSRGSASPRLTWRSPTSARRSSPRSAIPIRPTTSAARVGAEGYKALYEFVQQGGTLITEGSTAAILPQMKLTPGVAFEDPPTLFARGTILRGMITDHESPLVYGYDHGEVPVYFNSGPVLNAGAGAPAPVGRARPHRRA